MPRGAAHKLGVAVDAAVRAAYVRVDRVAAAADFGAREDIFSTDFCDLHLIFAFICSDFSGDFSENLDFKLKRRSFTDKKINLSNLSSFYNRPK